MQKVIFFPGNAPDAPSRGFGFALKRKCSKFRFALVSLFVGGALLAVWDLRAFPEYVHVSSKKIPFSHRKHGENLGLECSKCHPGADGGMRASMPARADCMDCHNLPLSESPEIEKLDRALPEAPDAPFAFESLLPANVVFSHGVHAAANVPCETCHGSAEEIDAGRRPDIRMRECLACHRGERGFPKASTDCARCHR